MGQDAAVVSDMGPASEAKTIALKRRGLLQRKASSLRSAPHTHPNPPHIKPFPASATPSAFRPATAVKGGENIPAEKKITQQWQNGCAYVSSSASPFCLFHVVQKAAIWLSDF
jgi:hypothetical protein